MVWMPPPVPTVSEVCSATWKTTLSWRVRAEMCSTADILTVIPLGSAATAVRVEDVDAMSEA